MFEVSLIRTSPEVIRYQLTKDEIMIRNFDIHQGYTYVIDPFNKDNKHSGRHCIVLKFESDEKASVKFVDNGRMGKILLSDLSQIESNGDKKRKLEDHRIEVEQLLQEALRQREELDAKIDFHRQELIRCKLELERLERF